MSDCFITFHSLMMLKSISFCNLIMKIKNFTTPVKYSALFLTTRYAHISRVCFFALVITPALAVVILHLSLIIVCVFYTIIRCIYSTPPDSDFATIILLIPCSVQL